MARTNVFISYRRDDAAGFAQVIRDRLVEHISRERVFMDVHDIDPGADFVKRIEAKVDACDVLICLIGRRWAGEPASGRSRLDDPRDWVRTEVGAALRRGVRVIPVLLDGAAMPSLDELPEDLRGLARLNALEVRTTRVEADTWDLVGTTVSALGGTWPPDEGGGLTYAVVAGMWGLFAAVMAMLVVMAVLLGPSIMALFGGNPEEGKANPVVAILLVGSLGLVAATALRLPLHHRLRTMTRAEALRAAGTLWLVLGTFWSLLDGFDLPNWIGQVVFLAGLSWMAGNSIQRRSRLALRPTS